MSNHKQEPFEYKIVGDGEQNILFFNGFRIKFNSWDKVYPTLSKEYRVILFNRLGVGLSSKASVDQTGEVVVEEIHKFLSDLKIKPPYLIVAHSLGGIFGNLFARKYPNDVSGVVFVDSPHPLEIVEQRKYQAPSIVTALNDGLKNIEKIFDEFKYSEDEQIKVTLSQIDNASAFPNVPIAVVSGTKKMPFVPDEAFNVHRQFQTKLLALSTHSRHYWCDESGHFPQITEPEAVIKAIKETASAIKLLTDER